MFTQILKKEFRTGYIVPDNNENKRIKVEIPVVEPSKKRRIVGGYDLNEDLKKQKLINSI